MNRLLHHSHLIVLALAVCSILIYAEVASATITPSAKQLRINGRELVALNSVGKRIWKWDGSNPVTDAMIGWRGYVYVTALDGNLFALGKDGQEVWSNFLNGSGQYMQIKRYGVDGFVAKIDASAYREKLHDSSIPDEVQIFRQHKFIRSVRFPVHAQLAVRGSNIYALFHRNGRLRRRRVL